MVSSVNEEVAERYNHTTTLFQDYLYILAGAGGNDVWRTLDMVEWSNITTHAPWKGRWGHTSVVYEDQLYLLGGFNQHSLSDVWSTSDGSQWSNMDAAASWGPRHDHTTVVFDNKIWIIGGNRNGSLLNDVWYYEAP